MQAAFGRFFIFGRLSHGYYTGLCITALLHGGGQGECDKRHEIAVWHICE